MKLRFNLQPAGFTLIEFVISTIILTIIMSGSTAFFIRYINDQIRSIGYLGSMEENMLEVSMLGNMIKSANAVQIVYPLEQANDDALFQQLILEKGTSDPSGSPYSVISTTEIADPSRNDRLERVVAIKDIFLFNDTAFDSLNHLLYYTNTGNHTIRAYNVVNGENTVIVGIPGQSGFNELSGPMDAKAALLNSPAGIHFKNGVLYISDTGNNRIRTIKNGLIETVAGNGEIGFQEDELNQNALQAPLHMPMGLTVDPLGNIIFADTGNHRIRTIGGGIIKTIAGKGYPEAYISANVNPREVYLNYPIDLALDQGGNLYISDSHYSRIVKLERNASGGYSNLTTIAGGLRRSYGGDDGLAAYSLLNIPSGLEFDNGRLIVSDSLNHSIRVIESGANALFGDEDDTIRTLVGFTNRLLINSGRDSYSSSDDVYINPEKPKSGFLQGINGEEAPAQSAMIRLNNPSGITTDEKHNIYFTDSLNNQIRAFIDDDSSPIKPYHQVTIKKNYVYTLVKNPPPEDISSPNAGDPDYSKVLFQTMNLGQLSFNSVSDYVGQNEITRFRFSRSATFAHPYIVLDIESAYIDEREINTVRSRLQTTLSLRNYDQ